MYLVPPALCLYENLYRLLFVHYFTKYIVKEIKINTAEPHFFNDVKLIIAPATPSSQFSIFLVHPLMPTVKQ